ncbi:MAG: glycoside hydrolase domain-containing protein [Terriglobales bacterium]|jgi:glycoside hydrolase-like protein
MTATCAAEERATMRALRLIAATLAFLTAGSQLIPTSSARFATDAGYLGFDRNDYPGDSNLKILRQTFSYSGYWLNNPPGAKTNSWIGKRKILQAAGFGFLVLFNGRTYAEIKSAGDATKLGSSDAAAAVRAARAEGFPIQTIIFLDQEQGGRLLPEQRKYLHAWVDGVTSAQFGAGVYCSGIAAKEGPGVFIVTAEDIRKNAGARKIKYWVVKDSCPPSPGCTVSRRDLSPESSGISFADVWQFSQSPKRTDFARGCSANYNKDGNCYPPGIVSAEDPAQRLHVDLDVATSSDPSHGRTRD